MASALLPGDPSPATLSDLSLIDSYLLARYSFSFSYFPSDIIYFIIIFSLFRISAQLSSACYYSLGSFCPLLY